MERGMCDIEQLHAKALAEGYKDETCSHCGTEFLAHIHFVKCEHRPCPMISGNPPSILDKLIGTNNA
jgi:hypothetical protein